MISSIRRSVGEWEGSWFEDNLRRVVGDGGSTYFLVRYLGEGVPLQVQFPRLFDLAVDKWVTVRQMESRGWGDGGAAWEWRRRLLAWEEESVSQCASVLHNVVLQDHIIDRWRWLLDPINGYSVEGTYSYLTAPGIHLECGMSVDLWKKQVPLKVSVFVWRFLRNRIPTKDNLLPRRIISLDDTSCTGGCGSSETVTHLLIHCDFFWYGVASYLSVARHLIYCSSIS